jgi:site-specific DNA-methyltransferase (adenine-specific)
MAKEKNMIKLLCGDNRIELKNIEDNSVDSIVTDPPYALVGGSRNGSPQPGDTSTPYGRSGPSKKKGFMGKEWDGKLPDVALWKEVLRVAKPGAFMVAFGGTRTYHRLACAIEDAGWEIRDCLMWVYGSGFPKSHNIGKAVDKLRGNERVKGALKFKGGTQLGVINDDDWKPKDVYEDIGNSEWEGWGTALKPAFEPIILAQKPREGTFANNVLKYGCGALNIDESRVKIDPNADASQIRTMNRSKKQEQNGWGMNQNKKDRPQVVSTQGRWPANFIHDGSEEVLELFPNTKSGSGNGNAKKGEQSDNIPLRRGDLIPRKDHGSAARFFYCAKASKSERGDGNNHPTVKPIKLMKYLCTLITPPNGIILDPFMGSNTTGKAAKELGFNFIGIELEEQYFEIAKERIET